MNEAAKIWWQARTLREQRLLIAMFAMMAVVFAWLLVIRPVGDALSAARERHGAAVQAVAEARAQAELVRRLEKTALPSLGGPIDSVIGRAATDAGFPISGLQREGPNQATFISNSVRPQAFFAWVDQMEAGRGLIVERLSATANSDRTLSVQVTFRTRGG
jgi:general secretion pathway protein M